MVSKQKQRQRRHKRIRAKINGTGKVPRLSVFRSGKYIYAQLIDDKRGATLCEVHGSKTTKKAYELGKAIAQAAKGKKVEKVLFDRGGYKYHGRVKAVAEGAREGGLKF
jgi:large subunit ribosomal protein L18